MTYVSENFWHDAVNKATTDLFTFGYKHIIKPHFVFNQTPDVAHDQMIQFCKITKNIPPLMWACREMLNYSDPVLETSVMGVDFVNPFAFPPASTRTARCRCCSTTPASASKRSDPPRLVRAPAIRSRGSTVCPNMIR